MYTVCSIVRSYSETGGERGEQVHKSTVYFRLCTQTVLDPLGLPLLLGRMMKAVKVGESKIPLEVKNGWQL